MQKFSERYGYSSSEKSFQRESVDVALRTKIWNILKVEIWDNYNYNQRNFHGISQDIDNLAKRLWFGYFNKDLDNLPEFQEPYGEKGYYKIFKEYFNNCKWFEFYDFLEAVANDNADLISEEAKTWINFTLENLNSAYRFVGNNIAEITNKNEIESIDDAIKLSEKAARTHLIAALRMLSDRENPDYRNSVKESISAVESTCRLVTGNPSATLGEALKKVQNLHPAMARAFAQLYGYTNDSSGIRHSLTDEATISYADAKFMLVTCSAFVSYLTTTVTQ
jgi:hypothetical protein